MAVTNADGDGIWTAMPRSNNARLGRALLQALFLGGSTSSPLSAVRSGLISTASDGTQAYDGRVTVQSGLTLSVNPVIAILGRAGQGPYMGWTLPPARTVKCDTAPATNPRNDIVVARAYDTSLSDIIQDGGTVPMRIEIVTGTPGPTPADPVTWDNLGLITTIPGSGGGVAIPLARARVSTGGVVTVTDLRRGTGLVGGVRVLLPGDALSDPSFMPGDLTWFNGLRVWDGTIHRPLRSGADVGGEWRGSAAQSLVSGVGTKLQFPTAAASPVPAPNGITFNGADTWTIQSDGLYAFYAQARKGAPAVQDAMAVSGTSYSDGTLLLPGSSVTGYGDVHVSGAMWLQAGQQVCAWYYNGGATAPTAFATRPPKMRIWKQQGAA